MDEQQLRAIIRDELTAILLGGTLDIAVPLTELVVRYPRAMAPTDDPAAQETAQLALAPEAPAAQAAPERITDAVPVDAPAAVDTTGELAQPAPGPAGASDAEIAAALGTDVATVQSIRAANAPAPAAPAPAGPDDATVAASLGLTVEQVQAMRQTGVAPAGPAATSTPADPAL